MEAAISDSLPSRPRPAWTCILGVAAAVAAVHVATNGRYGFHRDELQFLTDARHLDWGFVPYPPLTAFLEHVSLAVFGLNPMGLRLASVLAQAAALVVTGLMAREFGGRALAQAGAVLAVAASPLPLFNGTEFQYTSFDFLWWVLIAYFTARWLRSEDPRWWLAIGAVIGLGLETKYALVFFVAGLLAGLLLTPGRRLLGSGWLWGGVAVATVLFLPNLVWLIRHVFVIYRFLQHIHIRDVGQGRAGHFFRDQAWICVNAAAAPLAVVGWLAAMRSARFRMIGWMYAVTLVLFSLAKGRGYYVSGAYPMLLAMGAAATEGWLARRGALVRRGVPALYFAALAVCGGYIAAIILPLASSGPLREFALKNNGDLREEFGWEELVNTAAGIRDSLPAEQRASFGIVTFNYGEAGAIEMLGGERGLPPPISLTNSAWLRGYPSPPPTTLLVIGLDAEDANALFTGCRLAGHNGNRFNLKNEESEYHPDLFLCGPPSVPWPEFWKRHQSYG